MPVACWFEPVEGRVFSRGWGVVTDSDALTEVRTVWEHLRERPGTVELVDLRAVADLQVTSGGVRELALLTAGGLSWRRAVVTSGGVVYGMARMFQLLADTPANLFLPTTSLDDGFEWLRWPADTAWPDRPPDWQSGPE